MKHPIERLRPVFHGNRCCGFLMRHIRGWDAHDATGNRVGIAKLPELLTHGLR